MEYKSILLILLMWCDKNNSHVIGPHKLIHENDVSEHCRRRVFPSIFLGRQIVKANFQILQFSRLDLPYSCFISIRTESGGNMIMVVQLRPDDLKKSCTTNSHQLLMYELGETFGGYWGPLPDSVMRHATTKHRLYTLKATRSTSITTPSPKNEEYKASEEETEKLLSSTDNVTKEIQGSRDFIDVEIPIVNVSVHLAPGPRQQAKIYDAEAAFDLLNDVTPIPGNLYNTEIMPLLQFSIREDNASREGDDQPPKYELDILRDYTPDMRLTLPNYSIRRRKPYYRRGYPATKRLNFKKHKHLLDSGKYILDRRIVPHTFTKYEFPTQQLRTTYANDSWGPLENLARTFNASQQPNNATVLGDPHILENTANANHDFSVYLHPNWSQYRRKGQNNFSKRTWTTHIYRHITKAYKHEKSSTILSTEPSLITNVVTMSNTYKSKTVNVIITTTPSNKEINMEVTQIPAFLHTKAKSSNEHGSGRITGAMVGHESWENIVQAAPEMAIKLNGTVTYEISNNTTDIKLNETRHRGKLLVRKKKEIHAINIENARPHYIMTKKQRTTTTKSHFDVADMQEFAQLVEMQDNELHGRVALRYLRQYVGPVLYNVCNIAESTQKHVHLINSSRIILAISNFTLDSMTVILTSARTLLSGETKCPSSHLECQVSGARVCFDSTVACDGVPNCGSYDIYDEDRLLCGASTGLQHNVYVAAFTFLAVLLTMLYAVHYWLKRCVPKVADAFFIYTEGIENILHLDTIMRSPNGGDNISKMPYQSTFYEDDNIFEDQIPKTTNTFKNVLRKCCFCLEKKTLVRHQRQRDEQESFNNLQRKRLYSFTYSDIPDMFKTTRDMPIQTGVSLEMKYFEKVKSCQSRQDTLAKNKEKETASNPPIFIQDSILSLDEPLPVKHADELSVTKFLRAARKSESVEFVSKTERPKQIKANDKGNEIELKSYNYDNLGDIAGPSGITTKHKKKLIASSTHKHLRFDNVATTIPVIVHDEYKEDDSENSTRSIQLVDNRPRHPAQHTLDTIDEADEPNRTAKESRHFWGTSKFTKSKKKTFNRR